MHLDDEQIQRSLHGELDAPGKLALSEHAAGCAACRLRLEEAAREEEQIFGLLRQLDHAPPAIDAERVAARARGGRGARGEGARSEGARRESARSEGAFWMRRAAVLLVAIAAAGVVYAVPGSPLPMLVARVTDWIGGAPAHTPPPRTAPPAAPSSPSETATAGISVAPGARFTIRFASSQARGVATVTLSDGPDIVARVSGAGATFTTDADVLTIENRGSSADYEIELPRNAPWVEIQIDGQTVFLEQGDRIVTSALPDASGRYVLPLATAKQ